MNTVWFPSKRIIRTAVQVFLSIATILATIALIAPQVIEALADVLPGPVIAWLTAAVASITALSMALSKIMLIPKVNEFLTKFGAGTAPAGAVEVTLVDGERLPMTHAEYATYRQAIADDIDQANAERDASTVIVNRVQDIDPQAISRTTRDFI